MSRISKRMPWVEFCIALLVLLATAVASDNVTARLEREEYWVSHSHEVETLIARLRGDVFAAGNARQVFILTGDQSVLSDYARAKSAIPNDLAALQKLTADNTDQQARLADLRNLTLQNLGLLQGSIDLREQMDADALQQRQWTATGFQQSSQIMASIDGMEAEEDLLLVSRQTISEDTYRHVRMILLVVFSVVILLLTVNFYDLSKELKERREAEEAILGLNGRILRLQDSERRRVARELHDSIGQIFALLKMNLELLSQDNPLMDAAARKELFAESVRTLDEGLSGARTLSHLLHPPLLDELGFASAAQWLVEGFSKRSGIQVKLEVPDDLPRMDQDVETALFRILQEALTNIHKHSGSQSAEIRVALDSSAVSVFVRDFGKGIPASVIENFRRSRPGVGVGLAGMRERVRELGGRLELKSEETGAVIEASIPLPTPSESNARDTALQPPPESRPI